jgi:hypothetical protein
MSSLLGQAVLDEVRAVDRVLDMGTAVSVYRTAEANGFTREEFGSRELTRDDQTVRYVAFRLRAPVG